MLIPTRSRLPLPRALSYPIGAEALSAALQGVPQYSELSISFFFAGTRSDHGRLRGPDDGERFVEVVMADFTNTASGLGARSSDPAELGYLEPWRLWVYPVPRVHKFAVRQALTPQGLGHVRAWLEAPRSDAWMHGRKHGRLSVRPADGAVRFQDTDA